ncbi:DUF4942 domain-containing protein [Aliarcobacter butzleri]|uniref:DUF4942 domain-containing protein n=1 Tax=Aliarcobacter butzleri TaxID=28197 RepID=UPI0021B15FAA|nr:DUF4942 domain-containing protein [Aliarcobacter butzleri]UXC30461.1 DUF4942 domain-containing protein [Aliarcobacter butzleri]
MSAALLVKQLKNHNEDFEFYPTTREILEALYWDINGPISEPGFSGKERDISLLDVGAGNCKLLSVFKDIASSQPLLDEVYYEEIPRADEMIEKSVIAVKKLTSYKEKLNVVYANGEEDNITLHQFVLTLKNNPIENIDLSSLEIFTHFKFTDKDFLLKKISNYELPTRKRHYRENNVVRINKYMAIEKSQILINNMPDEVFVVGTDFNEQTLLDKKADIIFSNPPYKEYSYWSEKIIKEANASSIYLVIPQRWDNQENIIQAIKKRNATYTIVGEFDFLNSEDRTARAKVNLLRIDMPDSYSSKNIEPFDLWFNECFKIEAEESEDIYKHTYQKFDEVEKKRKETIQNQIVKAGDLVSALVELYNQELDKYINNYKLISQLDADVLKELNVKRDALREALKIKIEGLKNLYWHEIFDNLTEITSRLTSKSRDRMLETLRSNTSIDFTKSNIRAVVIWVIKNAPKYYDNQLLQVYRNLSNEESAKLYKSDHRFSSDNWRYYKNDNSKYKLDYRIVVSGCRSEYDDRDGKLSDNQMEYIRDLIVVARNLGFNVERGYSSLSLKHKYTITTVPSATPRKVGDKTFEGKIKEVYYHTNTPNKNGERVMEEDGVIYVYDKDLRHCFYQYKIDEKYYHHNAVASEEDVFTTVIGHKNGNVHFQINQQFMKKFNLEAGRLNGWLKTPQEAADELDISIEEANSYWKSNFTLLPKDLFTMLPQFKTQTEQDVEEEFKKDSEKQNVLEIKEISTLYGQLIQNLLEIHNNGKLYGIRNEDGTCSYTMANNFYENKEHYMSGKSTGVGYAIEHKHTNPGEDEVDTFQGIKFRQVKPIENVPFETIVGTEVYLSRDDFEEFVKTNQNYSNMDELGIKFQNLIDIKGQKIEHKEENKEIKYRETSLFDFL